MLRPLSLLKITQPLKLIHKPFYLSTFRWFSSQSQPPIPDPIPKCYYEILRVDKDANTHDIRQEYIKLSKDYHPDKNPEALVIIILNQAYFSAIQKAYETLHDDQKRAIYDEEQISDEDYFGIQIGPFKVSLFVIFGCSLAGFCGVSIYYFYEGKRRLISSCPLSNTEKNQFISDLLE